LRCRAGAGGQSALPGSVVSRILQCPAKGPNLFRKSLGPRKGRASYLYRGVLISLSDHVGKEKARTGPARPTHRGDTGASGRNKLPRFVRVYHFYRIEKGKLCCAPGPANPHAPQPRPSCFRREAASRDRGLSGAHDAADVTDCESM
jgi:hypothetical protein